MRGARFTAILVSLGAVLLLASCSRQPVIPVSDLSTNRQKVSVIRIVNPGDTLYSIAWGAGLDYRQLAQWNGLRSPYTLRPGQKLSLVDSGRRVVVSQQPVPSTVVKTTALPRQTVQKQVAKPKAAKSQPAKVPNASSDSSWRWPVRGKVLKGFAPSKGSQGLDIAVPAGTPVKSSSSGRVVYAGSGLRGYGQLVIVKHSDTYLSAYGHNRKLLVSQGDQIVRGQVIAESGNAPGSGDLLHFEIRKNGRPVNPTRFLPSR